MNAKITKGLHRHRWQVALLPLIILPFVPELVVYAVAAVANAEGCPIDDGPACFIAGAKVSDIIGVFLRSSVVVAAAFAYGVAAVWLLLCYWVIGRGWTGFVSRLLLASLVSLIFGWLPYWAPGHVMEFLVNAHCQPDASGSENACQVYGGSVGIAADEIVIVPVLRWPGSAFVLGVFVIYAIRTAVRVVAGRRVPASIQ
jgi:hypothetical protein